MTLRRAVRALFLAAALGFGAWAIAGQWAEVAGGFARLSWAVLAGSGRWPPGCCCGGRSSPTSGRG